MFPHTPPSPTSGRPPLLSPPRFLHSYPQCLFFLDLLQHASFRKQLAYPHFSATIANQQLLHWIFYNRNRARPAPAAADAEVPPVAGAAPP